MTPQMPTLPSTSADGVNSIQSLFMFAVCQIGAEKVLKDEIALNYPGFRFAFSRPGFVTFKQSDPASPMGLAFELRSVFARSYGLSLEKFTGGDFDSRLKQTASFIEGLWMAGNAQSRLRLHVWERDRFPVGEAPPDLVPMANTQDISRALRRALPAFFAETDLPTCGDTVLDLLIVEPDQWWLGCHDHSAFHSPFPGGKPKIALPVEAPSRAYLKIEEALLWSSAPFQPEDQAVELGSAPGGASYALLKRGLKVIGVDPSQMDAVISKQFPDHFKHLKCTVAELGRGNLPARIDWLLADMNIAPHFTLPAIDRLATRMKDTLLGVLLTLKLNEWKLAADLPAIQEHLKAMGIVRVRMTQLASNKQEICVFGLTRLGMRRMTAKKV